MMDKLVKSEVYRFLFENSNDGSIETLVINNSGGEKREQ